MYGSTCAAVSLFFFLSRAPRRAPFARHPAMPLGLPRHFFVETFTGHLRLWEGGGEAEVEGAESGGDPEAGGTGPTPLNLERRSD